MNKRLLLAVALISFLINAQPDLSDQIGFGGDGFTSGANIIPSDNLSFFICGSSRSSQNSGNLDIDHFGSSDCFLMKLTNDLEVLWQKSYGGEDFDATAKITSSNDAVYLFSSSRSGVSGNKTTSSFGDIDGWLLKLDLEGNIIWQKNYGGTGADQARDVYLLDDGSILLFLTSRSPISGNKTAPLKGERDVWVIKLDSDGVVIWDKTFGTNGDVSINDVASLNNGQYAIAATCIGDCDAINDKTESAYSSTDTWAICINTNGDVVWDRTIGGDESELFPSLIEREGEINLISASESNPSGVRSAPKKGGQDIWMVTLNLEGEILSDISFGGDGFDTPTKLYKQDDELVILSRSNSGVSHDKTEENRGEVDYWIIKLNNEKEVIWDKTIGGTAGDSPNSLLYRDGRYIIGGVSSSEKSGDKEIEKFNSDPIATDIWIVVLDEDINTNSIIEDIVSQVEVYPNPTIDELIIKLTNQVYVEKIDIYDIQGNKVISERFGTNDELVKVDVSKLALGSYILNIQGDGFAIRKQVVKQ